MPSDAADKSLIAQVALSHVLDRRRPSTYLRRNLDRVLDCHERQLMRDRSGTKSRDAATSLVAGQRPEWDFARLPGSTMRDLVRSHRPVLTITALSLRLSSGRSGASTPSHKSDEHISWLPAPDEIRLPCQVTVAIYDSRSARRRLHMDLRQGIVSGIYGHGDRDGYELRLDEPFQIGIDKLCVVTSGINEKGPWRRELEENTVMELGIQFLHSDHTAEFLREVEGRESGDCTSIPSSEGILRAEWTKLPQLPGFEELLPLKRTRGHSSLGLRYGAKVRMGWNQPRSPVTRFNEATRRGRNEPRQLPTPSSVDMDEPALPCTIKYLYSHQLKMRSAVTTDLKCLLCPSLVMQASFDRLRLHFLTYHRHLRFDIEEDGESDDPMKIVTISVQEDRQHQDESELNWLAPERPFDIAAHLQGRSVWLHDNAHSFSQRGASKSYMAGPKSRTKGMLPPQSEQALINPTRRKNLLPEEVPDLPVPKRRKHEVPSTPGISFYRTTSKRAIEPGTLLAESDEELDEFWFEQAARDGHTRLGIDQISQDFHEAFNKHLDIEDPMSDTLTRDAIIRFARKFKSKLSDPAWKVRFEYKLTQLESRNVIDHGTVQYCMGLLAPTDEHDTTAETEMKDSPVEEIVANSTTTIPQADILPSDRMRQLNVTKSTATRSYEWSDGTSGGLRHSPPSTIFIRTGAGVLEPVPLSELLKDSCTSTHITRYDLDPVKFGEFLKHEAGYVPSRDHIMCCYDKKRWRIADEDDWVEAITEFRSGTIKFELQRLSSSEPNLQDSMTGKRLHVISEYGNASTESGPRTNRQVWQTLKSRICMCGKEVKGIRGNVACSDALCGGEFHMQCVRLQRRPVDWRCKNCTK